MCFIVLFGFHCQNPQGGYIQPEIMDNADGTYAVSYKPDDVGVYTATVKYGGQQVPKSPFRVKTSPTGDASKVKIAGQWLPIGQMRTCDLAFAQFECRWWLLDVLGVLSH